MKHVPEHEQLRGRVFPLYPVAVRGGPFVAKPHTSEWASENVSHERISLAEPKSMEAAAKRKESQAQGFKKEAG